MRRAIAGLGWGLMSPRVASQPTSWYIVVTVISYYKGYQSTFGAREAGGRALFPARALLPPEWQGTARGPGTSGRAFKGQRVLKVDSFSSLDVVDEFFNV